MIVRAGVVIGRAAARAPELPRHRCGEVAEDRGTAGGEHSRPPAPLHRQDAMADVSVTQPELQQMRPGHHAVLRVRDRRDQRVLGAFSSHADD